MFSRLSKTIVFLLILTLVSMGISAQNKDSVASPKSLRVLTYNIWNGFNWGKDLSRKDSMTRWIREQAPDVIAFQELCGFTQQKLAEWAKEFGHENALILKEEGYPIGITSRYPIRIKAIVPGGKLRGFLHAETGGVEYIIVHMNPSDVSIRQQEAQMMRSYIQSVMTDPTAKYLVLGDFNAHSPLDINFDRKFPALLQRTQQSERPDKPGNLLVNQFDYGVVSSYLSIPLVDVVEPLVPEEKRKTFPAHVLIGRYYTPEEMKIHMERIDFILACPLLAAKCTKAYIFNSGMPDKLSDHYPVMAVFSF